MTEPEDPRNTTPTPPEIDAVDGIEELGDAETSPAIPSAAVAAQAASTALLDRRAVRRRTDREIWELAWPVILSQALASVVSLIDIAMVGRLAREAVAAVGYTTQYLWLIQSALFAVSTACVALMSRAVGAQQLLRARRALAGSLVLAGAISVGFTLFVVALPAGCLRLLAAEEEVIELALPYFLLVLGSSPLLAVMIILESGFRAVRDTWTPMVIATLVTVVKTALNFVLIFGALGFPRLELLGAGLATLISEVIGVACFAVMARRPREEGSPLSTLALKRRDFRDVRSILPDVVRISLPAVGERVVMNVAMMTYFALLGVYGNAAVAAYTIGIRILSFSWIPGIGFSVAAATLVGQSLGARQPEDAARAGWRSVGMALYVSLVLGVVYAAAREPLAWVFTSDAGVVDELLPFMLVLALAQPLLGLHFTLGGALRGAGDTMTPLLAATLGNWVFRVPLAIVFAKVLSLPVIWVWIALVFDHLARSLWCAYEFRRGRWKARLGATV